MQERRREFVEIRCQLWEFRSKLIGGDGPLLFSGVHVVLREDGFDEREDNLALPFAGVGQRVAHEVNAATLPCRFENLSDRCLRPR